MGSTKGENDQEQDKRIKEQVENSEHAKLASEGYESVEKRKNQLDFDLECSIYASPLRYLLMKYRNINGDMVWFGKQCSDGI